MLSYFGYAFTMLLMFYIITAALFQGLIVEKMPLYHLPKEHKSG